MRRPRPDLLTAASVPVLLVAGVLPWQRDVMCTQAGCGPVTAGAWTGSPAWALVLLTGLTLAGTWVLLLPGRGRVPSAVAALTALVAVLAAAVVVVSADALVFNRTGLVDFDLPVTETFPVLAVHPAEGLVVGLAGLLLQAVAGWSTLRHRNALVSSLRPPTRPAAPVAAPAHPAGPFASVAPATHPAAPVHPAGPLGSAAPVHPAGPLGSAGPVGSGAPGREAAVFAQGPPQPRRRHGGR